MATQRIINPRRNRLLRQRIPVAENLSVAAIGLALVAIVIWVAAQRDNFRPEDRDVSAELLAQASRDQSLYTPPLQPWMEPGTAHARATAGGAAASIEPFPVSVVDSDWKPTASSRHFNADNLFEKINGEAPRFLRQGFLALHYLVLRSETHNAEIAVELFDQGEISGSIGVFGEHVSADRDIQTLPDGAYFETSIGAIGRSGRYFFRIAGDDATDAVRSKAVQIVAALSGGGQSEITASDSGEPLGMRVLRDRLDVPVALISFQNSNVFQYDFAQDFWFGRYDQASTERLFVHLAESSEAATQLYDEILVEHEYDYDALPGQAGMAAFHHPFLNSYFLIQVRDRYVFGVDNGADLDSAKKAVKRLSEALADE